MTPPPAAPAWYSPRRWFFAGDGLLRPFWRALLYLLLGFILLVAVQNALRGETKGMPQGWRLFAFYLLMNAGLIALARLFLRRVDRSSFRTYGLWFYAGWGREFAVGLAVAAALIGLTVLGMVIVGVATIHGMSLERGAWLELLRNAAFLLLAAAFEEVVFRGYAFQRLVDSLRPWGAVLALSALFGAGHIGNPESSALSTANTVLAGILLSLAYLKTRALWLPIALHWAWNFLMGPVLGMAVSGNRIGPGLVVLEVGGPVWLSGGGYGPEGGAVLTVLCVAGILWLWMTEKVAVSAPMAAALKKPTETLDLAPPQA
jgi:hypothetical protein